MNDSELQLLSLMTGPKMSDRAIRTALGLTQGQMITLAESVRGKLGIQSGADVRAALRAVRS